MDLKSWIISLEKNINKLSKETQKHIPYMVYDLVDQCKKATSDEPDATEKIRIAMIGAFSSGKSSFLNALLDTDLAYTDINRATRCITDFTFGENFKITNIKSGESFSTEDYKNKSKEQLEEKQNIEDVHYLVSLPDERLEGMILVDSPGFDAPKDGDVEEQNQDYAISKRAAEDADVCFFVVSIAKQGTITEDCLQYLKELNKRNTTDSGKPIRFIIILNQADKKMESERKPIVTEVKKVLLQAGIDISDDKILLHTSRKPKKNSDFYNKCQDNIWKLIKELQKDKLLILQQRHGIWAKVNRQGLLDLKDILIKFTESESKSLEHKEKLLDEELEEAQNSGVDKIADFIKDLCMNFNYNNILHTGNYAYISRIKGSGIFWDDYNAKITSNKDAVIPQGEERKKIKESIINRLKKNNVPSVDIYAEKFMEYIDNFIVDIFNESDGGGYYKRHGLSRRCSADVIAKEECDKFRREFYNELCRQAPKYFQDHVSSVLRSLMGADVEPERQRVRKDNRIISKIERLLTSNFPALNNQYSGFQHPIMEFSEEDQQRCYLAELLLIYKSINNNNKNNLLQFILKLNTLCKLEFTEDKIHDLSESDLKKFTQNVTDEKLSKLLIFCDATYNLFGDNEKENKNIFDSMQKLPLFSDIKDWKGIYYYLQSIKNSDSILSFIEKIKDVSYCSVEWSYMLINKGVDHKECLGVKSLLNGSLTPAEIYYAYENNDFTLKEDGSLIASNYIYWPFNSEALDFLVYKGCNLNEKVNGKNILQDCSTMLNDDGLTYLLENNVEIGDETWEEFFIMGKSNLISIAMNYDSPPSSALFQCFLNAEVLLAYLESEGDPNLHSEDSGESLIDYCIINNKNDLVEILRKYGAEPSEDVQSFDDRIEDLIRSLK